MQFGENGEVKKGPGGIKEWEREKSGAAEEPGSAFGNPHKNEEEIRSYLSGNPTINRKEMDKHIEGTGEYRKYLHNRLGKGLPPQGCFREEDQAALENELLEKLKSGRCELKYGRRGEIKAVLSLDTIKGKAYNQNTPVLSDMVEVSVSVKKGVHAYPYIERNDKNDI